MCFSRLFQAVFIACFISFSAIGHAQDLSEQYPGLPENVVKRTQERVEQGTNPSVAIGIIDEKGARYYNFGNTRENGEQVNEHTIYEIGSISKVFTGILLALQQEQGVLQIDDPIQKYLPEEVKVPAYDSLQITFGHLSDHTSSLPRLPGNFAPADYRNPYEDYSVEQMYAFLSVHKLNRRISSQYEYSNFAVGLLGHILALNADMTYEELMLKEIANPLGMHETRIELDESMRQNLATGHDRGKEAANWDIPTLAGAGAIRSSASDMIRFLTANLGLSETSLRSAMDLSHQARHDMAGLMRVGLGWHIKKGSLGDVIWHNGGTGGYRAFAGFVKETKTGVVVLTNSTVGVDDIGFHLLDPQSKLN